MATLWLHVGPAKSGTTTIQRCLQANRRPLRRKGLIYPDVPLNTYHKARFAHHFLPLALAKGDVALAQDYVRALPTDKDIVLSSETFRSPEETETPSIADLLSGRAVKVIFYAREPVSRSISLSQQMIRAGTRTLAEVNASPPVPSLRRAITGWERAFGRDNMIVREFAPSPEWDLITDFFDIIGYPAPEVRRDLRNPSITLETAMKIDAYRSETGDSGFVRSTDERFAAAGTKFTLPAETIAWIRNRSANDVAWLKDAYGIDFGRSGRS